MRGQAMHAVGGSDRGPMPLVVPYSEPKPKPKGLDWAAISPNTPETPEPIVSTHKRARRRGETHCTSCGRPTPTKGICTHCQELEEARRDRQFEQPTKETPMATPPTPKAELVDEGISLEVRTVMETLTAAATSTDMVVGACRAAVIAAVDALHGALLRAPVPAKSPGRAGARTPKGHGRNGGGVQRIEEERPEIVEEIRRLYVGEGRGIESVASHLGISGNTVSNVMHRNHIDVRPPGGAVGGESSKRLAERLKAMQTTAVDVRSWAKKNNVAVASRGTIPESVLDKFEAAQR